MWQVWAKLRPLGQVLPKINLRVRAQANAVAEASAKPSTTAVIALP